jgi:hypothetical protein
MSETGHKQTSRRDLGQVRFALQADMRELTSTRPLSAKTRHAPYQTAVTMR